MLTINVGKTALTTTAQNDRGTSLLSDYDVNKILKHKLGGDSNFRLVDWRLELFGEGKGFLGQYYHLCVTAQVDGDDTKSPQFFVKTPPPQTPQFDFLQRHDTFNKEIVGYTDLARRMGVGESPAWMVNCYCCKRDVVIVLEDASLGGCATLDKYIPFDVEHCVLTLKTLSRLHSKSLILDERLRLEGRAIPDLYGHLLDEVLFSKDEISMRFLSSDITGIYTLIAVVKRRIAEWSWKLPRLLGPSKKYRNVICHRDVWTNNIMFRYDPSGKLNGCRLIDFQFYTYCPPAIDFTFCLYLTADQATRDLHFDAFARIYHDSFAQLLAEDSFDAEDYLPWTTFRDSCMEVRNVAIVYAAHCLQIMLLSSNTTVEYFVNDTSDRLMDVMYGDGRRELVLCQCEKEPSYKARLLEVIHEIKDRLPDRPPMNI
ncbi:hypothetical protein X777_15979 [Ooceraea biroi]|uniref:CHK kinase-like domain-containing protein n=1 Tax=Ooceraea biroi TaxID=2015173 RepID=A0A026WW51_OOCBI|nr:hypothetical protein X777_15979 [Ooceraea biroi]